MALLTESVNPLLAPVLDGSPFTQCDECGVVLCADSGDYIEYVEWEGVDTSSPSPDPTLGALCEDCACPVPTWWDWEWSV